MKKTDVDSYINGLKTTNILREPTLREIIDDILLPIGSHGLDVGCGIGLLSLMLAEALGPKGHVTGLDISEDFIFLAEEILKKSKVSDRISFKQGDMYKIPFYDDEFDWVISSDCAGYAPSQDPLSLFKELSRVVKPGGDVIIIFWSSQQLLPGYPLLEAKLNLTSSGIAPFINGMKPELHCLRTLDWFIELGLEEPKAKTFKGSACAPLSDEIYNALIELFEIRWINVKSELSEEDFIQYQRLCQPDSPEFILNIPGYYAFFTYSMFTGKVPK